MSVSEPHFRYISRLHFIDARNVDPKGTLNQFPSSLTSFFERGTTNI